MPVLHIANTFFEHELADETSFSLSAGFHSHPLFLQLQYLPFLYGRKEDAVLVTHAPPPSFLDTLQKQGIQGPDHWYTLSGKIPKRDLNIESWGMSPAIADWARQHKLSYDMPQREVISEVNSKAFSFIRGICLPHSHLFGEKKELLQWIKSFEGPKVLKSCYGLSGRGHFHISSRGENEKELLQAQTFAAKEWQKGRPILAEPWVERALDFSSQWHIRSDGRVDYLGSTICKNDRHGRYLSTCAGGPEKELFGDYLPFLDQHKDYVAVVLAEIAQKGFFGHLGLDAMVYRHHAALVLQPIVEINARKTMGWVALEIARQHFAHRPLHMTFGIKPSSFSLLPVSLQQSASSFLHFPKQLCLTLISKQLEELGI